MVICGLVLTLGARSDTSVVDQIADAGPLIVGQRTDHYLALTLEADSSSSMEDWHRWLQALPGIVNVEVAFVSFEEEKATTPVGFRIAKVAPARDGLLASAPSSDAKGGSDVY
jgi:hypothetical protein